MSLEVGLKKIRLVVLEDYLALVLGLGDPGSRWMFSEPDLLQRVWPFHLRLGIWTFHHSLASTLPLHWVFEHGFQMRLSFPIPQCLRPWCLLSRFPQRATHVLKIYLARLLGRSDAVATHQARDLECFAGGSNIPWNPLTIFHPDLIANSTAAVPSLILRTALSAIPSISDLCGVDLQWFQERSSRFAKFQGIVSVSDFWFPRRLQGSFCFTWVFSTVLVPLQRSMTLSRFTSLTQNFVIRGYQITKNFRSGHDWTRAYSARSPHNFGSQADIATSALREVSKDAMLTRYHFCSRLWKYFMRRTGSVSVFCDTFIYQVLLELF